MLGAALPREALVGLGSTYRTLGRHAEAEATLQQGRAEFPEARERAIQFHAEDVDKVWP